MAMKTTDHIFITGANGLVGSYLVRYLLDAGYDHITCTRRENSDLSYVEDISNKVQWVTVDLMEADYLQEAIEGHDYVFHIAAYVTFDPGKRDEMFKINVEGTANVVNACLSSKIKKLIFVSSIAALGRNNLQGVIDEKVEWQESHLNSDYAKSKFLAELEVWRGSEEGLDVVILNPSLVLGAGDWKRSSLQLVEKVANGSPYYPKGTNGFVDVRDVAKSIVMAAQKNCIGERFIISAENVSYKNLMEMMALRLGSQPPKRQLPDWMLSIVPVLEKIRSIILFRSPIITKASLTSVSHTSLYSNKKSKEILGVNYLPIEKTIDDCIDAYLTGEKKILPL
jgi:nucleoside-diphosphate-sugar epimerase